MEKIVVIIQARMGSSRLPGKVLADLNGRPMLDYQIHRLTTQAPALDLFVATSDQSADDAIEKFCRQAEIQCYRGDEADVLTRFWQLAEQQAWDDNQLVIRLTADCPLVCPSLIEKLLAGYKKTNADYGRIDTNSYPRGVDAEVFKVYMLRQANLTARTPYDREHVTPWFYSQSSPYRQFILENPIKGHERYRLCVDEQPDYDLIKTLLGVFTENWSVVDYPEIISYLDANPSVAAINAAVIQNNS